MEYLNRRYQGAKITKLWIRSVVFCFGLGDLFPHKCNVEAESHNPLIWRSIIIDGN